MDFPIILLCLLLLLSIQGAAFFSLAKFRQKTTLKIPKLESASRKRYLGVQKHPKPTQSEN
jgi:hypothetical protein